jgi:hypothetical protein
VSALSESGLISHHRHMPFQIKTPDSQAAGVHADFVSAWHTPHTFVLDFAALVRPPKPVEDASEPLLEAEVVARVRIPPAQIFEIMKALERQLSAWETETGRQANPPTP